MRVVGGREMYRERDESGGREKFREKDESDGRETYRERGMRSAVGRHM